MLHVHSVLTPGEPGRNIVDIFRVENSKIAEHWDVIQGLEKPAFPPLTDNGIFNEQGDAVMKDPDKTEENRATATAFYEAFGNGWDADKCAPFIADSYTQHNPNVQDGKEAMGTGHAAGLAASLAIRENSRPRDIEGSRIRKLLVNEGVDLDKPTDGYWKELRDNDGELFINGGDFLGIRPKS